MPNSEEGSISGGQSSSYQTRTVTTVNDVNVVRNGTRVHDGVETADTSTATARKTPEGISRAGERQSADCQRQRGGLVVYHFEW